MRLFLVTACVMFVSAFADAKDCEVAKKLSQNGFKGNFIPCKANPCDPNSYDVTDLTKCAQTPYCFVLNGKCSSKTPRPLQKFKDGDVSDVANLLVTESKENVDVQERFFNQGGNTGGGQLPSFLPGCVTYPMGCNINLNNPMSIIQALVPPVDIPYCLRIPCNQMDPSLELNRNACVRNPGCYYDTELANIRELLGQQVLAGVPICQLVIRNRDFQQKIAKEKMSDGSAFNGLYSKCYIGRNPLQPNPGCPMISTLDYFGYSAKRAGWTGITNEECLYIDGCPTAKGCMLPAATSSIRVRSATINNQGPLPARERYGQPMCQPFTIDKSNADAFINDYNQCLQSGCVVDDSVSNNDIFLALYKLIQDSGLTNVQKMQVLQKVISGEVGPNNIKQTIKNFSQNQCAGNGFTNLFGSLLNAGNTGGGSQLNLGALASYLSQIQGNKGQGNLGDLLSSGLPNFGNQGQGNGNNNFILPFSLKLNKTEGVQGRFLGNGGDSSGLPGGLPGFGNLGNTGMGGNGASGNMDLANVLASLGAGGNSGTGSNNMDLSNILGTLAGGGLTGGPTGGASSGGGMNPAQLLNLFNQANQGGGANIQNLFNQNQGQVDLNNIFSGLGLGATNPGQAGLNIPGLSNNVCPFAPFVLAGMPALKGRFEGCCEQNKCFYPRTTVLQQYSGIASYYGQWSAWSQCTATCGGGRQQRKRNCVSVNNEPCEEVEGETNIEEKICNENTCPYFTNWSAWSACSATCGLGAQERNRICYPDGATCDGETNEQRECAAPNACPVFGEWSSYSVCSSNCGAGTKTRSRPCKANCNSVVSSELNESVDCYTVDGVVTWDAPPCKSFPNCYTTASSKCLKKDGTTGCCGSDFQEKTELRRCTKGVCFFCEMARYAFVCNNGKRSSDLPKWN